jgi:hypothetical protein
MKLLYIVLSAALFIGSVTTTLAAQNVNPNEVEKMKLEMEDRARRDIEQKDWETKIFQIKYVEPRELQTALSLFRSEIKYSGGALKVLSVRAPKEIMPAIEDAIKRFDVPMPRNDAELIIYVLMASDQDSSSTIPPALNPVVNQLKNVFSYKGYRLLDTLITRATNSGSSTTLDGSITISETSKPNYHFAAFFQFGSLDGKIPVLKVNRMTFQMNDKGIGTGISGDVDVPQGQQVVVGKATMGDRALILVMTSKFSN